MSTFPESELPCPRLELRWVDLPEPTDSGYTVACEYSFVFPLLQKYDIRAERQRDDGSTEYGAIREAKAHIGTTYSSASSADEQYRAEHDMVSAPYRDGAHANWDRVHFGNAPIFAVAAGRAMFLEPRPIGPEPGEDVTL